MPEILTTGYKSDINRLFVSDALTNQNYYLFVSSIDTFSPSDTQFSKNEFLEKTLFGKKIYPEDIHYMIKYYPWQRDSVYVEYDDQTDLTDQKFYAVVGPNDNDTGDYRIYKCLNNNEGGTVTTPPNYNPTTPNQIYETADGYVWKYMYRLTDLEFEAYNAIGYIPLKDGFDPNPVANTGGQVSDVLVENKDDTSGYVEETGSLIGSPFTSGTMIVDPSTTWSAVTNYYTGQFIYTTNLDGVTSRLFKITYYKFNASTGNAEIRVGPEYLTGAANPVAAGVGASASFKIIPRLEIKGDGTGAIGIPNIGSLGTIDSITMLQTGSGYRNAVAEIIDPLFDFDPSDPNRTDVRAVVRPRLTPDGGHGYNLIDEFRCKHYAFYAYITAEDNTKIGFTNTYSGVGIVRTPSFTGLSPDVFDNRIAVTSDDIDRVTANTILIQTNSDGDTVFSAKVHEVDESSNTFYLAEYLGPYPNNPSTGNGDTPLDLTLPFRNETGQTITINSPEANNVIMSAYTQRSGEVYFMENFFPLLRTDLSREEFKFVLEF